jgi:transcriptional regulator with XRE-family HTH domain
MNAEEAQQAAGEDRRQLDDLISELESKPGVKDQAAALDAADVRHRQLFHEIRERRLARKLTQTDVAQMVGTSQPAVARLEAGFADPRLSTLAKVAAALGYDLRFLLQPRQQGGPVPVSAEKLPTLLDEILEQMSRDPAGPPERLAQPVTVEVEPRMAGADRCLFIVDPLAGTIAGSGSVTDISECVRPFFYRLAERGRPINFYCQIEDLEPPFTWLGQGQTRPAQRRESHSTSRETSP